MTPCLTISASRLAKETCWFFNDGTHVPLCVDNNNMSMDPSILCACVSQVFALPLCLCLCLVSVPVLVLVFVLVLSCVYVCLC